MLRPSLLSIDNDSDRFYETDAQTRKQVLPDRACGILPFWMREHGVSLEIRENMENSEKLETSTR